MIMIITIIMITIMMTTPMITRAAGCRGCRRACAPGYYYYYHYDYYHYYDYYDHDGLPAQQVAEGIEELARRGTTIIIIIIMIITIITITMVYPRSRLPRVSKSLRAGVASRSAAVQSSRSRRNTSVALTCDRRYIYIMIRAYAVVEEPPEKSPAAVRWAYRPRPEGGEGGGCDRFSVRDERCARTRASRGASRVPDTGS